MGQMRVRLHRRVLRGLLAVIETASLVCVCGAVATSAAAQVAVPVHESDSNSRLLSVQEGRAIVNVAWQQEQAESDATDCSHLVHAIYASAGFEYPYASSFEIYAGNENFARVKNPHAGDVVAWPGHVGIVVDPVQHSFYSLVRTGLEAQDYESPYWKSRGRPRFYRYRLEKGGVLNADTAPARSKAESVQSQNLIENEENVPAAGGNRNSNRPPTAVAEKSAVVYGPPTPPVSPPSKNSEGASEIPASVIIAERNKLPTREEVADGISELSDAMGSRLRTDDPLKAHLPVVVVEQFSVERVDVKHGHGWARLVVDSKVLIGGGSAQVKRRREKVRWELRRTESGWEAAAPTDRAYVPHDVAVKNLAANLAQLTSSDGAAEHQQAVLRQEAQLASLLSALLESKQDR